MQHQRSQKTRARDCLGWLRWLLPVLLGLSMATSALAGVLRSGQEARMEAWVRQPALPAGMQLGDIAIGKDRVQVQVRDATGLVGTLLLQARGSPAAPDASSATFDFVWQGPPAQAPLQQWLRQLAARDPGGWWTPLPDALPGLHARRPELPWPLVLWGPLWLLLMVGAASAVAEAGTRAIRPAWRSVGLALGTGVAVSWLQLRTQGGPIEAAAAAADGAGALAALAQQPSGALATVWCWHLGGRAADWPAAAAALTGLLTGGAVLAFARSTPRSGACWPQLAVSAALLAVAALAPQATAPCAAAVWLAVAPLGAGGNQLAAFAGSCLLVGSGVGGAASLGAAGLWRLWRQRAAAAGALGQPATAHPSSSAHDGA